MQSGKPVGVFRTHPDAPRVLIANSNLVAHWATWDKFHQLDRIGLMMYGQMTAGSWIYIGSQGIIQGTYETFAEAGRQHYGGDLSGRWILTGGLGGMGGAQPLAATMAGASLLAVECRASRIERRLQTRYLDRMATDLDEALAIIERSCAAKRPLSVGLLGNAAEVYPELVRRGVRPDIVTDQTAAHDPLNGYLPAGWTLEQWEKMQARDPAAVERAAKESMAMQVRAMLDFHRQGVPTLDYGNNIRQFAKETGVERRVRFSGLRAGLHPADVLPRQGAVPLGRALGRPRGHLPDRRQGEGAVPGRCAPAPLAGHGQRADRVSGTAGADLLARASASGPGPGSRSTTWWRAGELKAPVVIGRDHLDSGSVASPNRETEAMRDGSDAVADWPLLNAMLNVASGATWVSIHHGGGVGIGFSQHAGMVIVCDGTPEAARRLERVLTNDPATGVMRHADAGYPDAIACAREHGLKLPMLDG